MSATTAGILQIVLLVALLAVVHRPLGDYMARVFTSTRHLAVERGFYRVVRVDPEADQRWSTYLLSLLGFSLVSVLFLFGFQRLQSNLPLSLGMENVPAAGALNTAVSFVTNTNWQWYSGESAMGHLVQMAGLAVQNFVSAAVGMAVAVALIRGPGPLQRPDRLGNFWVDLIRGDLRVSCCRSRSSPPSCWSIGGAVQNFAGAGRDRDARRRHARPSPAARSPPRRRSRSSAPTAAASSTPTPRTRSRTRTRGRTCSRSSCSCSSRSPCRGRSAGWSGTGARATRSWPRCECCGPGPSAAITAAEVAHPGTVPQAAGAAMEGKEVRFGDLGFRAVRGVDDRDVDRRGQLDARLASPPLGGGVADVQHDARRGLAGRCRRRPVRHRSCWHPGGLPGRPDGRPHARSTSARRSAGARSRWSRSTCSPMPFARAQRRGSGDVASTRPQESILNTGPHGLSEMLYAFTSASNNNGSRVRRPRRRHRLLQHRARAGMLIGRFLPIVVRARRSPGRWPSSGRCRRRRARCRPTDRCSSACSSASSSSSRPDLLPRARPRADRGGPVMSTPRPTTESSVTTTTTVGADAAQLPGRIGAGLLDPRELADLPARCDRKLDPRHMITVAGHVRRRGRRRAHHRACHCRPEHIRRGRWPRGCGSR